MLRILQCIFAGKSGFSILRSICIKYNETHLHLYYYFNQFITDRYYHYPGFLAKKYGDAEGRTIKA